MKRTIFFLFVFLTSIVSSPSPAFNNKQDKQNTEDENIVKIEDELADIKLGSSCKKLLERYPTLYQHDLIMGETLFEACNQENLEVFTFADAIWSKGYITHIWIHYADVSVCRDETGSLPDLSINPATPKGVRLGDSKIAVLKKYGEPHEIEQLSMNDKLLLR